MSQDSATLPGSSCPLAPKLGLGTRFGSSASRGTESQAELGERHSQAKLGSEAERDQGPDLSMGIVPPHNRIREAIEPSARVAAGLALLLRVPVEPSRATHGVL
jgi:hypothetical protein